jgi:hypothetical protein
VFAWEDGVFTLNAVRPPRRDEREEISDDDDDVDARTNRERRDARAEDRALARWRARDFAALLGVARSRSSDDASARSLRMKEYASAYAAFSALAYTAMAYAPHRFKPGNEPFHVVLNPLASPFAPGCVRSAPRGFLRRDPCPEAKRWKAPTLDFAASPTSRDVFPNLVNVPSADFVAAALRRSEDGSLAVDEASLRAAARGDEAVNAPSNASEASSTNDDGLDGALGWLTPWEARVSTVVWRGFAADAYAPRAPLRRGPDGREPMRDPTLSTRERERGVGRRNRIRSVRTGVRSRIERERVFFFGRRVRGGVGVRGGGGGAPPPRPPRSGRRARSRTTGPRGGRRPAGAR